jgi:hypothetical protein
MSSKIKKTEKTNIGTSVENEDRLFIHTRFRQWLKVKDKLRETNYKETQLRLEKNRNNRYGI